MRDLLIAVCLVFLAAVSSFAQVSVGIGIGLPGVNIGINFPAYPQLVPVPGYPVYYAPQASSNYFFYDGMYWAYQRDNWYASSWYNGPWWLIEPEAVPVFILRVPVRYYRQPPSYFRGWQAEAPPRWGEHWGPSWDDRHRGWDRWDRNAAPARAPLPTFQRQYSGERYPRVEQQPVIQERSYRYQPRDAVVQQHYQTQRAQMGSALPPQEPARTQPARSPERLTTPRERQQAPMVQNRTQPAAQGAPAAPPTVSRDKAPPGQAQSRGKEDGTPPGQAQSHGKEDKTPPGQAQSRGKEDKTPPGQAKGRDKGDEESDKPHDKRGGGG